MTKECPTHRAVLLCCSCSVDSLNSRFVRWVSMNYNTPHSLKVFHSAFWNFLGLISYHSNSSGHTTISRVPRFLTSLAVPCAIAVLFGALLASSAPAATAKGVLVLNPSSYNFQRVLAGTRHSFTVTLSNTGSAPVVIVKSSLTDVTDFSVSGLNLPLTIEPYHTASMTVTFKPDGVEDSTAILYLTSNAASTVTAMSLSGSGVSAQTQAVPASLSFGNVTEDTTDTLAVQVWNHGSSAITITNASVTGTGYQLSSMTTPHVVNPGTAHTFYVEFKPTTFGWRAGSVVLDTTGANSAVIIPLTGTGEVASRSLSVSPASLSFGKDATGTHQTLTVALKNTGNASVTISGISTSDPQLGTSGGVSGATLSAGQSASLNVIYSPTKTGTFTGHVSINSNATGSPSTIAATGSAFTASTAHAVALNWDASTSSNIAGYCVYRSTNSTNGFLKLTSNVSGLAYIDDAVSSGSTYYYAVSAVSTSGVESARSVEAAVTIP